MPIIRRKSRDGASGKSSVKTVYVCDVCGREYKTYKNFIRHLKDEFEAGHPPMFKVGDFVRFDWGGVKLVTDSSIELDRNADQRLTRDRTMPTARRVYSFNGLSDDEYPDDLDEEYCRGRGAVRIAGSESVDGFVGGALGKIGLSPVGGWKFNAIGGYDSDRGEITVRLRLEDVMRAMGENEAAAENGNGHD